MQKKHVLTVALVFSLLIGWSLYDFLRPIEEKVDWTFDYESALNKAQTENKTLMIYFYTGWCSWCKKLQRDTFSNDEVATLINDNFICLKINSEKNSSLATLYLISGYPTVLFLSAETKELGRIEGYRSPGIFIIEANPYILNNSQRS